MELGIDVDVLGDSDVVGDVNVVGDVDVVVRGADIVVEDHRRGKFWTRWFLISCAG